jgi:hypothetical protein
MTSPEILQAGSALAAVLLLLWGGAWLLERRGLAARPDARLRLGTVCALDARRRLVLFHCDGREGLLLTAPGGDQFLGWLPAPERHGAAPDGAAGGAP